jgi:hypothetical protein
MGSSRISPSIQRLVFVLRGQSVGGKEGRTSRTPGVCQPVPEGERRDSLDDSPVTFFPKDTDTGGSHHANQAVHLNPEPAVSCQLCFTPTHTDIAEP